MKRLLSLSFIVLLALGVRADEWLWVGGASGTADDAPWAFQNNWENCETGVRGFPNSADDIAVFDGDATLRCAWDPTPNGNSHVLGGIKVKSGTVHIYSFYGHTRPIEFAAATNLIDIAEGASLNLTGASICGTHESEQVVVLTGKGSFSWSGNSRIGALNGGAHRLKDFFVKDFNGGVFEIPSNSGNDAIYTLHLAPGMTARMMNHNLIENTCTIRLDAGAKFIMNNYQDVIGAIAGEGEMDASTGRLQMTLPSAYGPYAFGGSVKGTIEVNASGSAGWGEKSYLLLSSPTAFAEANFKPCAYAGGSFLRFATDVPSFTVKNYAPAAGQPVPLKDVEGNRVSLTMGVCEFNEYNMVVPRYSLALGPTGGTITAQAASTSAKPLVSGLDLSDEAEMLIAIDTKSFDTYIDQAFAANTTVEKYGASTLYATDSAHAKTSIEEGTVERIGANQQFGLVWDAPGGESTDLVWKGVAGASFSGAANWNPEQSPTRNDNLTVNGAASIAIAESRVRAKTLALAGAGTAGLSGTSEIMVAEKLSFASDVGADNFGTPKVVSVAAGSDVKIRTATQDVKNAGFVKAGAGDLAITYTQGGNVPFSNNLSLNDVQKGSNGQPFMWYQPLKTIPEGNAAPTWSALGNFNVLEGSMKITGAGSGFAGNNLIQDSTTATYLSTFGRRFDEADFGCWSVIGGAYPAEKAELVIGNANATFGMSSGNGKPIVGAFTQTGGPTHPALRLENNFCGVGDLLLGFGLNTAVWPEFTMTNSILRVYNFVRFGGWDHSKQYLGKGWYQENPRLYNPVVRLGAGAELRHQLGGSAAAYVSLGGQCDVLVEDGAKIRMERHNTGNPNVGGFLRTDSWATGYIRFTRGALLTFVNGIFCNNYELEANETDNFTFQFDGGIIRPVRDDGSLERPRFPYFFVAHPEYQGIVALAGGLEANITGDYTYTFAAPIRGEGAVRKTGTGTLVIAKGREPAADDQRLIFNPEDYATLPLSGVTTLQNAGGLVWEEGELQIEEGALGVESHITLCGQMLDLGGQTGVRTGAFRGTGTVTNASFAKYVFEPVADGAVTPTLSGVTFTGLPMVDFKASVEQPIVEKAWMRIGKVTDVTGLPAGEFAVAAINSGIREVKRATCRVDADGTVWAKSARTGFYLSIR